MTFPVGTDPEGSARLAATLVSGTPEHLPVLFLTHALAALLYERSHGVGESSFPEVGMKVWGQESAGPAVAPGARRPETLPCRVIGGG